MFILCKLLVIFRLNGTSRFSKQPGTSKLQNAAKNQLEKVIAYLSLNLNDTSKVQYKSLQNQLNEIIENEIKGVILRSLCDDYEQGGKCSKYFFSLEKHKGQQKTISRLKLSDGSFTSDQKIILAECRLFYKNLYAKNVAVDPGSNPVVFLTLTQMTQYLY